MSPISFPEANTKATPPSDLEESQCSTISAFFGEVTRGSCDGVKIAVVCWMPNELDLERLNKGQPVYLTCLNGLPPHFLSTSFKEATNPA